MRLHGFGLSGCFWVALSKIAWAQNFTQPRAIDTILFAGKGVLPGSATNSVVHGTFLQMQQQGLKEILGYVTGK